MPPAICGSQQRRWTQKPMVTSWFQPVAYPQAGSQLIELRRKMFGDGEEPMAKVRETVADVVEPKEATTTAAVAEEALAGPGGWHAPRLGHGSRHWTSS